jgi:hypothetical protein
MISIIQLILVEWRIAEKLRNAVAQFWVGFAKATNTVDLLRFAGTVSKQDGEI